jgi:hypothetical protein
MSTTKQQSFVLTTEAELRDVQFLRQNTCRYCGSRSRFTYQERHVEQVALCGQCFFDAARFEQEGTFPYN